ncbi:GNAT family N-acetyltransferase [Terrarubrum flagellatum]|uniref:GNAT family N-acetyltransferase n=1 Tax=Terrirubrum flagellatum TaxID=2895980 RepID=UPI0031450F15
MSLSFRLAGPDDVAHAAAMIDAIDRHYLGDDKAPGLAATTEMVAKAIHAHEGTRFLLAFDGGTPVGVACFAILRPGHRLSGLIFVKDLFVLAERRGGGTGKALLGWLAAYAKENGIGRMELTTEPRNPGAVRLYESLGAEKPEKIYFRFPPEVLTRLARDHGPPKG